MTTLRVFKDLEPKSPALETTDALVIASTLGCEGIKFERWHLEKDLSEDASSDEILVAYQDEIEKLLQATGYQSYDIIKMEASHPQKNVLRTKFFAEHTHSEDEIRFFVRGKGLFTMHVDNKVFELT